MGAGALAKVLVPVIERLAGAVETIQGNYATLLAKIAHVNKTPLGDPHWVYWVGALGTLAFAGLALRSLQVARKANKIVVDQIKKQDRMYVFSNFTDILRSVNVDAFVYNTRAIVSNKILEMFVFSSKLPTTYHYYYFKFNPRIIPQMTDDQLHILLNEMRTEFGKIAELTSEDYDLRCKYDRQCYDNIILNISKAIDPQHRLLIVEDAMITLRELKPYRNDPNNIPPQPEYEPTSPTPPPINGC